MNNISRSWAALATVFACVLANAMPLPARAASGRSACELLTAADIAKVLGAPVSIQKDASGPDPNGGDNCVWNAADRRNVMIRIVAVADKNMVDLKYKFTLSEAFSNGKPPEPLPGVGDEAKYRIYTGNLKGGVVVGRKGQNVFVVEGSTSREGLADLSRTMLTRL